MFTILKNNIPQQDRENTHMFNNTLSAGSQEITIISTELVELINRLRDSSKQISHSDLLKKVPKVLGKDEGKFSSIYLDKMNREQPCYNFPKREASLMAMSYSYEVQAVVFDHMTRLEQQAKQVPILKPESKRDWIMFALQQENEITKLESVNYELESQLALQAPAINFVNKVVASDGLFTIKQVAEQLGIGSNLFFAWLRDNHYLHPKGDNYNIPYSEFVTDKKYFEVKISNKWYCKEVKGLFGQKREEKIYYSTVYITPKGLIHLERKLNNQD
jgi:phage antirepressor YoqD-like protein